MAHYSAALIEPSRGTPQRLKAYLAGLLHDIGRLILNHLAPESAACFARMIAGGVECQFAEMLLCGFDHCEAGAQVLREWNLPEAFVNAIGHHHDPENTGDPLASVLYLAEHQSASAEDAPSLTRLQCAARRCGLSPHNTVFAEFAPLA